MGTALLIFGLLLFAGVHLCTSLRLPPRAALRQRIGAGPYMGLVSVLLITATVLIAKGWQGMSATPLYQPPYALRHLTMLLMPLAIILFIAPYFASDLRRLVRHPQLTGVKTWALAHLLVNGEPRNLLLFGALLAWAVASVVIINRRDGAWTKPDPTGAGKTALHAAVGLVVTGGLMFAHPWMTGMPLF